MIEIVRKTLNRCKLNFDNQKEESFCKKILSLEIEGAHFSEKFQSGHWDGRYKFLDKNNYFGFGLMPNLINKLEQHEKKYVFRDEYFKTNYIDVSDDVSPKMFYYQRESIIRFFEICCGTIKVPPRGGKTYIASEMFRIYSDKFESGNMVFFVDTEDLFIQAINDISSYFDVDVSEIGMINSKKKIYKRINVAMIQTCVSTLSPRTKDAKKKRSLLNFMKSVTFIAIDEVHENSSDLRLSFYKKFKNLTHLASFSGTPLKQFGDLENNKMIEFFGGIIFEIPKNDLQNDGFLSKDKVFLVHVNHAKKRFICSSYHDYLTNYIHKNEYRNSLLCQTIEICIKNKWKTLVLFNSKKHGNIISKEMGLTFISGDDDTKVRTKEKKSFLSGRGKVLLASNIFKKGVTLPEAQILIFGDGGLEGTNITQKYSRVLGVTEDKNKAAIIDFMDAGVAYFSEHSLNRLEVYSKEMGDENIEVYNDFQLSLMEEGISEWLNYD